MTSSGPPRRFTDGIGVGVLTRIYHRDLVDDVLRTTRHAGQRTRLLPPRVVVYFTLAMCLFYTESYEEVIRKMVNGLRFLGNWSTGWHVPTSSAVTQARQRVGEAPLAELFDRVAVPLARPGTIGAWYRGLRVMAVDGVVLDVPDTPDNAAAFAKFGTRTSTRARTTTSEAKLGPFPQVRLVGLGECGTHAITGACVDSSAVDERALLAKVIPTFEPGMLILADRGFYSYDLWTRAAQTGAQLLWRIKNDLTLPVRASLPDGSYHSELLPSQLKNDLRRGRRPTVPEQVRIPVRVIEYTVDNRQGDNHQGDNHQGDNHGGDPERIRVLTTLLDPDLAPAVEIAALYQQRWEFELTLDEVETHQMANTRMLRSKTRDLVRQEIWALLLTHYAVRAFMREAADDIGEDPDRLAFVRAIRVIRRQVENQAGFSPLPPDPGHPGGV